MVLPGVMKICFPLSCIATAVIGLAFSAVAQNPGGDRPPFGGPPDFDGPPPFGPGRGPGGPGGFGGPQQEERKLVSQFDKDGNNWLNAAERKAAREFLSKEKAEGRGPRRPGGRGGGGEGENGKPGVKLSPKDVKSYGKEPLFDLSVLRTVFIEFDNKDWEKELGDFYRTDVDVPARVTVDGKVYPDVGVHFHGASSYFTVGEGSKRSLSLSFNFQHEDQRLLGYRNLDLLNSHTDPTFLRTVLSLQITRDYIPAPKANFARVVINGESWGVFISVQHFDKDFINDNFQTKKGARWKVPGSPRAQGGLKYLGENLVDYKKHYEIKSKDEPKAWTNLIRLCRVLEQTPAEKLEKALEGLLDIEGALKFLALENVLVNNDGYWVRTSDYSIYEDEKGKFHLVPHDENETFALPGGPGFGGGRGGRRGLGGPGGGPGGGGPGGGGPGGAGVQIKGVELDPFYAVKDSNKPLISKLLAVPSLRARYLGYVRDIAERWLDWRKLEPVVKQHQALIAADVKADTRKLDSYEAFLNGATGEVQAQGNFGPPRRTTLKSFCDQRRAYLLNLPEVKSTKAIR